MSRPVGKPSPTPNSLPTEAADVALEAAKKYLRDHDREAAEIIVLLHTESTYQGEITGGTAIGGKEEGSDVPGGVRLAAALLRHFQIVMESMGKAVYIGGLEKQIGRG